MKYRWFDLLGSGFNFFFDCITIGDVRCNRIGHYYDYDYDCSTPLVSLKAREIMQPYLKAAGHYLMCQSEVCKG